MNLANITAESFSAAMEREIPEMYVVLAKHSVMGMDSDSICDVLGCEPNELVEVESDQLYKDVRQQIGAMYAEGQATRVFGWDGIEATALEKLAQRIPFEKDSDFLLKVAAVANKAQRRGNNEMGLLEPNKAGRTAVTLTSRMVRKLQYGTEEITEERRLSIHDGSMGNATFEEVDSLLDVRHRPVMPEQIGISTRNAEPSLEDLTDDLEKRL